MKLLSQRDSRWTNKLLGFNTDTYTIGSHGCLVTCLAMLLNSRPDSINDQLKEAAAGFVSGGYYVWGAITKIWPVTEKLTKTPSKLTNFQMEEIKTALDSGKYVMCGIDSNPATQKYDMHFVLLKSYSGENFQIYDPWTGTERPLSDYLGACKKTFRDTVEQYVIYGVEDAVEDTLDALKKKLEEVEKELEEMRDSRNKWKTKYEESDQEHTKDIQAKMAHIEELQKSMAELGNIVTQLKNDALEFASKIKKVEEERDVSREGITLLKDALEECNKENERLATKLKTCVYDENMGLLSRIINFFRGGA